VRGFCGLTFGNVATDPVIDFAFAALPAFATGHEPNVRDFAWIAAHEFRVLSLNAHWIKKMCGKNPAGLLCATCEQLRQRAFSLVPTVEIFAVRVLSADVFPVG